MTLIVELDEIGDGDTARVGGKARALAAMRRSGLVVPPALCLTTDAYERFVDGAGLRSVVHQELGRKDFADMRWEEIWDAALRIRNRFLRAPVPADVERGLEARVKAVFAERPLAVRSSAPGEDSGGASFAGLHDSFVGVRGSDEVLETVRAVWASLWTDRALLYRRELGIDPDRSTMAVVIQELVQGACSGIAFGIHPTEPEMAVVEAVYGLNQGLVDGVVEPDRWVLERATGLVREHHAPQVRRRLVMRGSTTELEDAPAPAAGAPPLDEAGVRQVYEVARAAESLFGAAQDVEWTRQGDHLVMLQSRPITASSENEGDKRSWYLSLTRSLDNLRRLRARVEDELLPAMDREAEEISRCDLETLDESALAGEIERRRALHDRWVDVYWRDFIPLAHGIRLFGQFYNQVVRPEDPFEFMGLLAATPMLAVRRNCELARLAERVRSDTALRTALDRGDPVPPEFEREIEAFEHDFGSASFAAKRCFSDRARVVRLLLAMAEAPAVAEAASESDAGNLTEAFLAAVDSERRPLARELLDLGRASYRLRDDDNLHLARLEAAVLDAVEAGRRRLSERHHGELPRIDLEGVVKALRHPNLVVEASPEAEAPAVEPGFRALPRQLVGQPAGPGVASAAARVVAEADDLFDFRPGEVLVCDAVDPNMTFVVPMASAVVERRGGMLIHGAIIAREYGLPCVTGVPDATVLIATGDRLNVDGYLGIVTVLRD